MRIILRKVFLLLIVVVVVNPVLAVPVQEDGEMEMTLTPGEGPQEISIRGGAATVEARWQGRELMVKQVQQRQTPRGNMTIEQEQTWSLSEDENTLIQQVKLKTPRGDFDMNLIFDRQ